ncbi:hypothetical protein KP509_08G054500 [Ceratopteris richardii]|uniref:Uncharacterized protein n=1 Tax=Ceratopteris richardii TaxID=49495 RepID=A0A8T2U5P0_CERRI|nr:hypothetical protein KP509_08G054500 [Ceratopteris richardii]
MWIGFSLRPIAGISITSELFLMCTDFFPIELEQDYLKCRRESMNIHVVKGSPIVEANCARCENHSAQRSR